MIYMEPSHPMQSPLLSCEFEPRSWRGVLDTTLCDKVSDLQQVCGFLRGLVSPTNKTDSHDIAEILLKVALNTITLTLNAALTVTTYRL
jgi:hypothetical protein